MPNFKLTQVNQITGERLVDYTNFVGETFEDARRLLEKVVDPKWSYLLQELDDDYKVKVGGDFIMIPADDMYLYMDEELEDFLIDQERKERLK